MQELLGWAYGLRDRELRQHIAQSRSRIRTQLAMMEAVRADGGDLELAGAVLASMRRRHVDLIWVLRKSRAPRQRTMAGFRN